VRLLKIHKMCCEGKKKIADAERKRNSQLCGGCELDCLRCEVVSADCDLERPFRVS
jgi:hypothetical protein